MEDFGNKISSSPLNMGGLSEFLEAETAFGNETIDDLLSSISFFLLWNFTEFSLTFLRRDSTESNSHWEPWSWTPTASQANGSLWRCPASSGERSENFLRSYFRSGRRRNQNFSSNVCRWSILGSVSDGRRHSEFLCRYIWIFDEISMKRTWRCSDKCFNDSGVGRSNLRRWEAL